MSASTTSLLDYVRDMDRLSVPPFREPRDSRLWPLACDLCQAAVADDARSVARHIRTARLERLWRVESWLTFREQRHPRIARWLHDELVAIGWRSPDPEGVPLKMKK
jgi:hypothetical protein